MRLWVFTCVTSTVAALRPMPVSVRRIPAGYAQRARRVYAEQDPDEQPGYAQHSYAQQGQQGQPQLPYPWEQLVDESTGEYYYSNPQTGVTSWEPPRHGGY